MFAAGLQRWQDLPACVTFNMTFCSLLVFGWWQLVLNGYVDNEIKVEAYDKDLDNDDFLGRWVSR